MKKLCEVCGHDLDPVGAGLLAMASLDVASISRTPSLASQLPQVLRAFKPNAEPL
jgi:hypothetical protein